MMVTYCVYGLMEWRLQLPTHREVMPYIDITFEGGQLTGYGVSPARYSTDDPYIQGLIEESRWFKNGRIRRAAAQNRPAPRPPRKR